MAHIAKRQTASGVRYDVTYRNPEGKQRRKTFDRKKDADTFGKTVEADVVHGTYVDRSNPITVASFARSWVESQEHLRDTTRMRQLSMIRAHIEGTRLGSLRVVDVTTDDIQTWVYGRAEHLAPSTLREALKLVRAVFAAARRKGIIVKSPGDETIRRPSDDRRANPRRPIKPERVAPLTVEEVRLLAATMGDRHRAMILTQAGLGLRLGELLALRVSDLNFLRRTVSITEQLHPRTRRRVPLKNRRRRAVPLPQVVADALSEHIAAYPPNAEGYVFTAQTTGQPYAREVVQRAIARAVKDAWLPEGTSSHMLRHHYVSVLLDAGESVVTVAERIGDTAAVVLDTYAHMMPDTDDRTRRAVDTAWQHDFSEEQALTT